MEDCLARVSHPEYVLLVARTGSAAGGFILLHPRGVAGSPYVASIAVEEGRRGRGLGTALMAAAEQRFAGARNLFLCVSSFNPRARELYERLGYTVCGELQDYVIDGASECLMRKRLVRA